MTPLEEVQRILWRPTETEDARDLARHLFGLVKELCGPADVDEVDPSLARLPDWLTGDERGVEFWTVPDE